MKLPSFFSRKSVFKKYLTILVSDYAVRSALVEVRNSGVAVLSQSSTQDYTDKQQFVVTVDTTLQELSGDSKNVDEVIFALETNWVNEAGIIDTKKPLLKEVTTQLSLKAVGFVVIPEAIVQAYGQGQGFSSLLAQVTREKVGIYLVHQGLIEKAETVGRSHQHTGDVFEGIARFTRGLHGSSTLPSTIVLTSFEVANDELETMRQELVTADWGEQKVFLQQPAIEIIPEDKMTEMVAIKGGEAVARSQGLTVGVIPATTKNSNSVSTDTSVEGEPIHSNELETPTSFGVPIAASQVPGPADDEIELEQMDSALTIAQQKKRKIILMIAGAVGAGLLVVFLIIFFVIRTTAEAIIVITPKTTTVSKELEITVDSDIESSDPEALILAGKTASTTVTGEDTIATTGRKLVGDPAKGAVTIYNKTSAEKSFDKGTEITSGSLVYTLDADVTITAAVDETTVVNPGKSVVTATAKEIGAEGNIKKDTKLTVASFAASSYEAVVNEDFTGGSSREVKVISEEDQEKVLSDLRAELLKDGEEKLQSEAEAGNFILPGGTLTITKTTYSGKVGDEANEVSVTVTATVKAVAYSSEDLRPIATKALEPELPSGYALIDEEPQVLSAPGDSETASGSAQKLALNISSRAKAAISESTIEELVAGLSSSAAQERLKENGDIQTAEIRFNPSLASRFGATISRKPEKITVEFK